VLRRNIREQQHARTAYTKERGKVFTQAVFRLLTLRPKEIFLGFLGNQTATAKDGLQQSALFAPRGPTHDRHQDRIVAFRKAALK
jgi:hypothetical protein